MKGIYETVEFKQSFEDIESCLDSIVAMLNKNEKAAIVFGVNEEGKILDVDIDEDIIEKIKTSINRIFPKVEPVISVKNFQGKDVLVLFIEGKDRPYSINGKYFIKIGSTNTIIAPDLIDVSQTKDSEKMVELECLNQDLRFKEVKILGKIKNQDFSMDDVKRFGLLNSKGKYNILADLMSDYNEFSVKVIRYRGKDRSDMLYRKEYGYECFLVGIKGALDFVNSLNETRIDSIEAFDKKDTKLFDSECMKIAWYNACLHTNWDKMTPPMINIFDDRMEIISYGGLPKKCSLEDFYSGLSRPINIHLQIIMEILGYLDSTEHGVAKIVKKYGKEAFTITDRYVIVTLKFPFEISKNPIDYEMFNLSEQRVLKAIAIDPTITTEKLCEIIKISQPRVAVILRKLKNSNLIERVGSRKKGYWQIICNKYKN